MDNEKLKQEEDTNADISTASEIAPEESKEESNKKPILIIAASVIILVTSILLIVFGLISNKKEEATESVKSYAASIAIGYDSNLSNKEKIITNYGDYLDFLYEFEGYKKEYSYAQQYASEYNYESDTGSIYESPRETEEIDISTNETSTNCDIDIEADCEIEPTTGGTAPTLYSELDIKKEDFDKDDFAAFVFVNDECGGGFNHIRSISYKNNEVILEIGYDGSCGLCSLDYTLVMVPIEKSKMSSNAEITEKYIKENNPHCSPSMSYKPMIYLYPESETEINVKLGNPELLTTTYPKYNEETGWNVIASPDGNLKANSKNYYGLYWEGVNAESRQKDEGFVVAGENIEKFLEEKLEILGLNERESNEFIVYWLPELGHNEWNYIRFATTEEIEEMMPLEITPEPETTIRVLMEFKSLEERIDIKEQELTRVERRGYTAVEWGGTKLGENRIK